MQKLKQ